MDKFNKIYLDIISEQAFTIVPIDKSKLEKMLEQKRLIIKNKRYNEKCLNKFFIDNTPDTIFYVLKDDNVIKAIAIAAIKNKICRLNYVLSLISGHGYGKALINYFLNQPYKLIYLNSKWSDPNSLWNYYRNPSFRMKEYINPISNDHWFYKNRMFTFDRMHKYITENFK